MQHLISVLLLLLILALALGGGQHHIKPRAIGTVQIQVLNLLSQEGLSRKPSQHLTEKQSTEIQARQNFGCPFKGQTFTSKARVRPYI
jgi:hypothetical protein